MLPTQAQLISEREQEIADNVELCGPALTDHDWTALVLVDPSDNVTYIQYVGADSDLLVKLLRMWGGSFAECNWCACKFVRS